jgi:uncharacterized protein
MFKEKPITTVLEKQTAGDRAWALPNRSWAMRMQWHDLLFMHWRIEEDALRRLIPDGLEIDTFDGSAWIGVVPFKMSGVAPRYVPNVPFMSCFPELNVRTYVTINGKPGVWFFCLEATNPIAVRIARKFFHLPYMDAKIEVGDSHKKNKGQWIGYRSVRSHPGELPATFKIDYRPIGKSFQAKHGSLEEFLTSRYCLYSADGQGKIFRGEIDHAPWQLHEAQAIVRENTMTDWMGVQLPSETPLLHFAKHAKVVAWTLDQV